MASEQTIERIRAILNSDSLGFGIRITAGGSTVTASSTDDEVEMSTNAARAVLESIRTVWGDDCAEVIVLGGLIETVEAENSPSPRPSMAEARNERRSNHYQASPRGSVCRDL